MGKNNFDSSALDDILIQLGDFGKYQIKVFGLVCVIIIFNSAVVVDYVFRAMNLDYRCRISSCDIEEAEYEPSWLINAIPYVEDVPKKCSMYTTVTNFTAKCDSYDFNESAITKCSSFVYKSNEETILQEYNLQCDENLWKITMVGTINIVGQFFGIFVSGLVSDWYGRKVVLIWGMVLCAICGLVRTVMPTYEWFLVLEFLNAGFGSGIYMCGFVLGVELVGPKRRVLTGVILSCCFAFGEIFTSCAAWFVKSWRYLSFVIYIPSLFTILLYWQLPESVRWNLGKGRIEAAKATLVLAAKTNGVNLSESTLERLDGAKCEVDHDNEHGRSNPIKEVLKSTRLMLRTTNCCFCWITTTFLFYGLSLNAVTLAPGNSYLDFILTALVELPSYVACNYSLAIFGRRKSLSGSYIITGTACLGFLFVPSSCYTGKLVLYLIGKFGATAAFTNIYVLTSEMFPTSIRHTFMGLCSTVGRLGSMIAPQIPLLAYMWNPLPLTSFAIMSLLAGLLSLLFPETLNTKLPDTIAEAENISKLPKLSAII